jgi:hypothetical protein
MFTCCFGQSFSYNFTFYTFGVVTKFWIIYHACGNATRRPLILEELPKLVFKSAVIRGRDNLERPHEQTTVNDTLSSIKFWNHSKFNKQKIGTAYWIFLISNLFRQNVGEQSDPLLKTSNWKKQSSAKIFAFKYSLKKLIWEICLVKFFPSKWTK